MMSLFVHPDRLWLLAFVPFLLISVARGRARRLRSWKMLGQDGRLQGDGGWGWAIAIIFLMVALAQPRWGRTAATALPPGHDVVLLVDASRSMGAEDAVPNRLAVAVETAESLVDALSREKGNRVAVVAFAGRGVTRCPLTENLGAAKEALRAIRPGGVRPGGTDLAAALDAAVETFDPEDHADGKTIVLFSDGEDHPARWVAAGPRLRALGVVVHSVAVGDPKSGHPIPEASGKPFLQYQGQQVLSKRDDRPFETLAKETGGAVLPLGLAPLDLGKLYVQKIAPVARHKREIIRPSERTEQFGVFVLAALIAGLAGSWPSSARLPHFYPWFLLLLIGTSIGAGAQSQQPAKQIEAGRAAFQAKQFEEALKAFHEAAQHSSEHPIPRYNEGAALFQLGRYSEAYTCYHDARAHADSSLRTKIDYALGNTSLALGDIAGAIAHYDDCMNSTAKGPGLDIVKQDAAINRKFAEERSRNPSMPPDPDKEDSNGAKQPRQRKQQGGNDDDMDAPDPQGGQSPDSPPPGSSSPNKGAGAGGAGGGGPNPPRPGSPEARLAAAVENIKEARKGRLEEETSAPERDKLDW